MTPDPGAGHLAVPETSKGGCDKFLPMMQETYCGSGDGEQPASKEGMEEVELTPTIASGLENYSQRLQDVEQQMDALAGGKYQCRVLRQEWGIMVLHAKDVTVHSICFA
jgi:hypothetical protein